MTNPRLDDVTLVTDLERALRAAPEATLLANTLGCMLWRQGRGRNPAAAVGLVAAEFFRRALSAQPNFSLAGLNLAETLDAAGRRPEAIDAARHTLTILTHDELDPSSIEGMPLCRAFDPLHVAWERAAWSAAGKPQSEASNKREVILWRLHALLARSTGELPN
jgi:hypothetical protein